MSDEIGCLPRYPDGRFCPKTQFQCDNNLCVSLSDQCDGNDDCRDNSDENPSMCGKIAMALFNLKRLILKYPLLTIL